MNKLFFSAFIAICYGQSCPSGALYSSSFNKCYMIVTTKESYELSEQYCNNIGGHLTSVRNAYENNYLGEQTKNTPWFTNFWIGINAIATAPKFVWTDGSNSTYTNWMSGQPEKNSYDLCVYITPSLAQWVSNVCHEKNGFICEFIPH